MKKIRIVLVGLLFIAYTFAQEKAIKITHSESQKTITIRENRRIRIKTTGGDRISGPFQIADQNSILVKNKRIEFSDIEKIKRHPLALTIITNALIIVAGSAATIVISLAALFTLNETLLLSLTLPAAAIFYSLHKTPNVLKGYKAQEKWSFEIITLRE